MADENKTSPTLSETAARALTRAFEAEAAADEPEAAGETPPPRKRRGWLWALLVLALMAGLGLGVTSFQYQNRFLPHTRVCGVDVSSLSLPDAKAALGAAAERTSAVLRDADGTELAVLPLPELVSRAAKAGVRVYPVSPYFIGDVPQEYRSTVLLGFGGLEDDAIRQGTALLQRAWTGKEQA